MSITVAEKFFSRESTAGESADLAYIILGTDDDAAAMAALAAHAPDLHRGFVRQALHIEPLGPGLWEGKVRYGTEERQAGSASFSFDTSGGSQHITQSRATLARYAPAGQTAPDFKGAIGVTHDSVEGVDITVPVFSFSITRYMLAADMTQQYIANLYQITGKTNAAAWSLNVDGVQLSFAAGEALFLGASGAKRSEADWELSFRFAASPNATGLIIGDINNISKKGWEYLWVRYADAEDVAAKAIVKKPVAAYVEKVYETGDFSALGL